MKQETLEEAAKRLFSKYSNNTSLSEGHYDYLMDIEDFKDASTELVKWRQERSYSEEELFINEVKDKIDLFEHSVNQKSYISEYLDEWFEKFKKK